VDLFNQTLATQSQCLGGLQLIVPAVTKGIRNKAFFKVFNRLFQGASWNKNRRRTL
jgi:hypothetical protein